MEKRLKSLLGQALDARTSDRERIAALNCLMERYPKILEQVLSGQMPQGATPSTPSPETIIKERVVTKVVTKPPKGYKTTCKNARHFLTMMAKKLSMDMPYADRLMLAINLQVGIDALGDAYEDYGLSAEKLEAYKAEPTPSKGLFGLVQKAYKRAQVGGKKASTIDLKA